MTSPLFTHEREVNPHGDSVHRQAAVSGSSCTQQPASSNVMHDEMDCGKLQQSDGSDVEKSLLTGKRDREFGGVSSQEQERFLSETQNLQ